MSAEQAINYKLQGSVATYLRCGGVVNKQIKEGLLLSLRVKNFFKSMNIWQSYKQERGCLMHFARLANTLLKDEESARDNRIASNLSKYSPILFFFTQYSATVRILFATYRKVAYETSAHLSSPVYRNIV